MPKNDTLAATGGDDTLVSAAGDDSVSGVTAEHIEALGLDPSKISADDPAITGVPRDELHDSIDRNTGTLTAEALELRRASAEAGQPE